MTMQSMLVGGTMRPWTIDADAVAGAVGWVRRRPGWFRDEVAGMATYFPHWLLVGSVAGRPLRCEACQLPIVPAEGAFQCLRCHQRPAVDGLVWVGQLPSLARPEAPFAPRHAALQAAGFPETSVGGATYLLVPLSVGLPAEWPSTEPVVRYPGTWLDAVGLPRYSATNHLVSDGRACLFAWGQWEAMPVAAVLQQRVVNHLASLLKVAAGLPSDHAWIGKMDHNPWGPR